MKRGRNYNPKRVLTASEKIEAEELKLTLITYQRNECAFCGQILTWPIETAHRIPKKEWIVKEYGWKVVNHPFNLRATHPGKCNDGVLIDPASRKIEAENLIKEIMKDLEIKEGE